MRPPPAAESPSSARNRHRPSDRTSVASILNAESGREVAAEPALESLQRGYSAALHEGGKSAALTRDVIVTGEENTASVGLYRPCYRSGDLPRGTRRVFRSVVALEIWRHACLPFRAGSPLLRFPPSCS